MKLRIIANFHAPSSVVSVDRKISLGRTLAEDEASTLLAVIRSETNLWIKAPSSPSHAEIWGTFVDLCAPDGWSERLHQLTQSETKWLAYSYLLATSFEKLGMLRHGLGEAKRSQPCMVTASR